MLSLWNVVNTFALVAGLVGGGFAAHDSLTASNCDDHSSAADCRPDSGGDKPSYPESCRDRKDSYDCQKFAECVRRYGEERCQQIAECRHHPDTEECQRLWREMAQEQCQESARPCKPGAMSG